MFQGPNLSNDCCGVITTLIRASGQSVADVESVFSKRRHCRSLFHCGESHSLPRAIYADVLSLMRASETGTLTTFG